MANEKDASVATGRRATELGRGLVDEAGRTIGSGTDRAAEAMRRVADAGTAAGTGSAETVREAANAAGEAVDRSTEQMRRLMGQSAHDGEAVLAHATRNLDLMVRCGSVFADGAQSLWREMVATSRAVVERRMSGLSQAAGARSVADLMAVQDRLAREEIGSLLGSGRRMAELSVRIAQDAAERLAENPAHQRPAPTQDRI